MEKQTRRHFLRATLGSSILLLAACAPAASTTPTAAPAKPTEPAKPAEAAKPTQPAQAAAPASKAGATASGSITIVVPDDPRSLQVWEAYGTAGYPVLRNVTEALLNRDPENKLVGELATRWEQTNPSTWRFTLRQGVTFHDGTPFNAEAAAFSLNHSWSRENSFQIRGFIGPELNARAVDATTLDVVTEAPDPILPARLYFSPIGSMKALQERPDEYSLRPIGTGPYRFVEWQKGQHIKLDWNPDWWGHGSPDAHGAATIKEATFVPRTESEVRSAMVTTGEADLARWINSEQCSSAPQCISGPSTETVLIRMDSKSHPALKDKRVREAIALSIDKEALMETLIGGGTVARQLVGPSALGYNPNLEPHPFDPERAKQLVAEAKAAGIPVESELNVMGRRAFVSRIEEVTQAVAVMMQDVGFPNVNTRILENAAFEELWGAGDTNPDRAMVGVHMHGNELMDYAASVSSYLLCDAKNGAFCDPTLDEMFAKANPLTGAEREKALQDIAAYAHEQVATIPIGQPNFFFGLSKRLEWKPRLDGFILLKEMKLTS